MSIAKTLISNEILRRKRIKGDRTEAIKRMNKIPADKRESDFAESTAYKTKEITQADKDVAELEASLKKL